MKTPYKEITFNLFSIYFYKSGNFSEFPIELFAIDSRSLFSLSVDNSCKIYLDILFIKFEL